MSNTRWESTFESWKQGKEPFENIRKILYRYRRLNIDLEIIQSSLAPLHTHLDQELINPRLLPASLLLQPKQWNPASIKIHPSACLGHHRDLSSLQELYSSGVLNEILRGHRSLYGDLPPIPIAAYWYGLNKQHRKICRTHQRTALEHLASQGWTGFKNQSPVAAGLDRYHRQPLACCPVISEANNHVLVVMDADESRARQLALRGGWGDYIDCSLQSLRRLTSELQGKSGRWLSLCHASDELTQGACFELDQILKTASANTIVTCDEIIHHQTWKDEDGYEQRQYRSPISAIRLYTRAAVGGLVTLPIALFNQVVLKTSYSCLESLRLDCLLQILQQDCDVRHCHRPLIKTVQSSNPVLPEQGWPKELNPFNHEQLNDINQIRQRNAEQQLGTRTSVRRNPDQPGCHDLVLDKTHGIFISILIPFRDQYKLTQKCVESIQQYAGNEIAYEIILIDNGSTEIETHHWIQEATTLEHIHCVRLDEPFNFSRLNNQARLQARGNFLLFLNNDIEFRSSNVLNDLLDPFVHPSTAAVGSRLHYPDGSLQHQGVVIVPWERRCVLEPGKHLEQREVIDSLIPLNTQEEFSAASAACLMVKTESFDAVGGFDEDLAVVFNDVDLCLRLRNHHQKIIVTPHPLITHHESISRGKDQLGHAWARHQRESGRLRLKHANYYQQGDPLVSPHLHHHSNRYEPAPDPDRPIRPAQEQILLTWNRRHTKKDERPVLIYAQFEADATAPIRPDILNLLKQYRRYFYVQVVAATPAILKKTFELRALKNVCDALIVRRNEGYDYGSWMTGIRHCSELIQQRGKLVLCNDSFWGAVCPIDDLIDRLFNSTADVIGLTDNLMYQPHLQSPFLMFNKPVITSTRFWNFWSNINCWEHKRSIVKNYEVGLPILLQQEGFQLESLYSTNANGNILHAEWESLICDRNFPFIKVSLLRDNPHQVDISNWKSVVGQRNNTLAKQIEQQLLQASHNQGQKTQDDDNNPRKSF